jgi:hypothetical protein
VQSAQGPPSLTALSKGHRLSDIPLCPRITISVQSSSRQRHDERLRELNARRLIEFVCWLTQAQARGPPAPAAHVWFCPFSPRLFIGPKCYRDICAYKWEEVEGVDRRFLLGRMQLIIPQVGILWRRRALEAEAIREASTYQIHDAV